MDSDYTIVPLHRRDVKKLEADRKKARKLRREIRRGNKRIFVWVEDGAFIAQGHLVYRGSDPDYTIPGRRVCISRLIVRPERRGQGIGTAMVAFLCGEARRQGFREISLGVNKVNTAARHVYEKQGFDTLLYDGEDKWGPYVKLMKKLD